MKLRAVLNGLAALAAVGVFYTFAFCMVDDVNDAEISRDYHYSTETEALSSETTVETNIEGANIVTENGYDIEKAEAPSLLDISVIGNKVADAPQYLAGADNSENAPNKAPMITPIYESSEEDIPVNTAVPDEDTEKLSTESAGADENIPAEDTEDFDSVPEESDDEIIVSTNYLDEAENNYAAEMNRVNRENITKDEIAKKMKEIEESLASQQTTPAQSITPEETTTLISSIGTFFETVPVFSTFTETEPVTSIVSSSPAGNEMFTAKVDGITQEFDAFELTCMIVSTEMSPSFSPEALKAQAVAAYSYVKYHNVNGLVPTVLVKRTIPAEVKDAVTSVWGKCCYYDGKVAQTVYTASSAGTSASSVNVWGGSVPYLTSVATPFDAELDPNYGCVATFSKNEIKNALESKLGIILSDDPENWLNITSRIDGNYVESINIDNQIIISGRKMRENILSYRLKSWCFDVTYDNDTFTFVTYGYGHGVGMSQNGANILAKQGYTFDQILCYYFTGITVE